MHCHMIIIMYHYGGIECKQEGNHRTIKGWNERNLLTFYYYRLCKFKHGLENVATETGQMALFGLQWGQCKLEWSEKDCTSGPPQTPASVPHKLPWKTLCQSHWADQRGSCTLAVNFLGHLIGRCENQNTELR